MDRRAQHGLRVISQRGCERDAPAQRWQFCVVLFFSLHPFLPANGHGLANPTRSSLPSSWAAQDEAVQQGLAALKDNRLDVALDRLSAAEREFPSDAKIRNFRAIVLAQLGRNTEAANEYREAIRLNPKFEDAYKNLGFLEWSERDLDAAKVDLKQALDLAPDDAFAHYYLGRVQLDAKLYDSAFQELNRSRVSWPADADFLIQAAGGYRAIGRMEDAHKILARLSTIPLTNAQVVRAAARLVSTGEYQTAIRLLSTVSSSQHPSSSGWAQFDLALAYLFAGDYGNSIDQARVFLNTQPTPMESASGWSLIGIASARLNRGEEAIQAFRNACRINPTQEEHWLNLTRELMELNEYSQAISAVQEGIGSNPKSYALHLRLGAAYLSTDRYSDAESLFRQLIAAGDPLPTSYVGLAQVLLRTGRAGDAVSELTSAEQKLGPNFLIKYFRGLALDRAGRPGDAIPALEEAIRLNPDNSEAHLALGKTELAIGHVKAAKTELQQSLLLNPKNVQAQRLLIQASRRAGAAESVPKNPVQVAETTPTQGGDLLGDFLAPEWQTPHEEAKP